MNAILAFVLIAAALALVGLIGKEHFAWPDWLKAPAPAAPPSRPAGYAYALEPDLLVGGVETYQIKLYRLVRWDESKRSTSRTPYSSAAVVNILVTDKETNANHWLFHGFERNILSQDPLMSSVAVNETWDTERGSPIRCLVLRVADTGWQQSLYVWYYDDKEPLKILTADQIWMADQIARDKYLVGYRTGSLAFFATFSVPDFKLVSQTPIRNMPE